MSFVWIALLAGLAGSLHCVGMCGPLVLAMPFGSVKGGETKGIIIYHAGRILAYAIIGALFGLFGAGLALAGFQQAVSIAAGIFMILFFLGLILPQFKTHIKIPGMAALETQLVHVSGKLLRGNPTLSKTGMLGFLNGLLPCGLVYMALAGALAQQNVLYGALFMALFGLGTFPAMALVSALRSRINLRGSAVWRYASPFMVLMLGVIFIVRGMNLGIPYLSPKVHNHAGLTEMQCCEKGE